MFKNLFQAFRKDKTASKVSEITYEESPGWYTPLPAEKLLNTPLRQQHITTI